MNKSPSYVIIISYAELKLEYCLHALDRRLPFVTILPRFSVLWFIKIILGPEK